MTVREASGQIEKNAAGPIEYAANLFKGGVKAPPAVEALEAQLRGGSDPVSILNKLNLPTADQESTGNALRMLAILGGGALATGAAISAFKAARRRRFARKLEGRASTDRATAPREFRAVIPTSKRASAGIDKEALLSPVWEAISRAAGRGAEGVRGVASELFSPTGSPLDKVWFGPAALGALAGGGYLGYKGVEKLMDKLEDRRRERAVEKAKQEFYESLRAQKGEAEAAGEAGVKYSGMPQALEKLAQSHVDGELLYLLEDFEKSAAGEDSPWYKGLGLKGAGLYLALLAGLGGLGSAGGYALAKKKNVSRLKHEKLRKMLLRRQMAMPGMTSADVEELARAGD
jgi:hypothetical protein